MEIKILTFDLEEWFHVFEDHNNNISSWKTFRRRLPYCIDSILDLLEEFNIKATFFCIGWIAETYPEVIKNIASRNYEIATHSYYHKLAHTQKYNEYKKDLIDSIKILEDLTRYGIKTYRAPGFSVTEDNLWIFDILIENGIERDCSIFPVERRFGGLNRFNLNGPFILKRQTGSLQEFPMNFSRIPLINKKFIFSGGGFFRIIPYSILRSLFSHSDYVMTYFHARDFDKGQPFNELAFQRRMKSRVGVDQSLDKLKKILGEFKFFDVAEASQLIDWDKAKQIEI